MVNMRTFRDIPEDEYFYRIIVSSDNGFLERIVFDEDSRIVHSIDDIGDSYAFGWENFNEEEFVEWYSDRGLCIERLGDLLREFSEKKRMRH